VARATGGGRPRTPRHVTEPEPMRRLLQIATHLAPDRLAPRLEQTRKRILDPTQNPPKTWLREHLSRAQRALRSALPPAAWPRYTVLAAGLRNHRCYRLDLVPEAIEMVGGAMGGTQE